MNQKQILFSTLGIVLLFAILYGVYALIGGGPDASLLLKVKTEKPVSRTLWNKDAQHTLVVFSDYQCPACKAYHEFLSQSEASSSPTIAVTKNVSFVFRYFPLYQIHKHAFALSYAAEAAGKQGKFKEITNRLFADQVQFEGMTDIKSYLAKVAKDLKLDEKKFMSDMEDKALQSVIQDDLALGEKLQVNATPTFFLDGEQLDGMSPEALLKVLKEVR